MLARPFFLGGGTSIPLDSFFFCSAKLARETGRDVDRRSLHLRFVFIFSIFGV